MFKILARFGGKLLCCSSIAARPQRNRSPRRGAAVSLGLCRRPLNRRPIR